MKKALTTSFLILFFVFSSTAQCISNVDFSTWQEGGWANNGNWVVTGGGSQVHQTINGNPTFFYSPFALMNTRISGQFRTTNADDDYMGFVFSFLDPLGQSDNYNCWLYDWKQQNQGGAQRGMSLNRLNGVIPPAQYTPTFFNHQNTPEFTCVQNTFGGIGWIRNYNHTFELSLTYTRAQIYIDSVLVFDQTDCFWPGRFGFYNYSQADCYYSNFQYSLYVDFLNLTPEVCLGDTAHFKFVDPCVNLNFGLTQYQSLTWNFGDGTTSVNTNPTVTNANPDHVYTTAGTYTVQLTVIDAQGCTDSATQSITVNPLPVAAFTHEPPCTGRAMSFTDISTGAPVSWQWTFGDGNTSTLQNPTNFYTNVGNYVVELIATDNKGCIDNDTVNINVSQPPVTGFSATTVCETAPTQFTDLSTGGPVSWQWTFGDGNTSAQQSPAHTYASANTYNAMLVATDIFGCTDTLTSTITVNPNPTAAFTAPPVCFPNTSSFTNNSTGNIVLNGWSFGDAQTSTQQNPQHTYGADGNYTAWLVVATNNGCTDSISNQVIVYPKPAADFSIAQVCDGQVSMFTNNSTVSSGTITTYNWDFGDAATGTQQNETHTYAAPGAYNTTLIVGTNNACADTFSTLAVVNPNPVAAFTTANVCYPNAVLFTDQSTGAGLTYDWEFGDTQHSTQQNASHNYAAAGNYTTTLIVTTSSNCSDTITGNLTVNPKPAAAFTANPVCMGYTTSFTDNSSVATGSIIGHGWDLADGSTSTLQNPTHTYGADGSYNVLLIVQTDSACYDTLTQAVVVDPLPVPDFNTGAVCLGQNTVINNTSTINTGAINQWWWDLGDGQTGTAQHPTHAYALQGMYTVILIATSDNGCVDSVSKRIEVFENPVAAFTVTEECFGVITVFTDNSTIGTGTIAQWSYDLGDTQASSLPAPTHTYGAAGTYTATLTVTSDSGCANTISHTVTVNPLPVVNVTAPDVCLNVTTNFSNASNIATGSINSYNWAFGDGNSSSNSSPSNTYSTPGNYTVSLVAVSDKACVDSTSKQINVFVLPVASATSTAACYQLGNGTASVAASSGTPAYAYAWSNGNNTATLNAVFAGVYDVTITDANSCTTSATTQVTEPAGPLTVVSTPAAPFIKINDATVLSLDNSYSDLAAVYSISPGYGLSCTDCAQPVAQPYQTTEYHITVTDVNGCIGYGELTVTVDQSLPLFVPNVFTPNGDGANDLWNVYSQAVKQFNVSVFNRWGEKVFESGNITEPWDGTFSGKPAPAGVYLYTGNIVYLNDVTSKIKGSVTLVR